jgi:hypothetical protein
VSFGVTATAVEALLKLLNPYLPCLPLDPRTLLQTPRTCEIQSVGGGQYVHMGLQKGLENIVGRDLPECSPSLELQFNIDGLPIFKSSNTSLWPILCLVRNSLSKTPFTVGCFCGQSKPGDLNAFMAVFVSELHTLLSTGFEYNNVHYTVLIHSFVCDTPARAMVKCVKGHSGYFGCDKCHTEGEWHGKVTFQNTNAAPRTDAEFSSLSDQDHHLGSSPLSSLPIGMVTNFPLDYMHLVCLGVVRRLLLCWIKGPLSVRLSAVKVNGISDHLKSLKTYIPVEFNRKPRSLDEVNRWKATEFRTFLLYLGPVVLQNMLPCDLYQNFMQLSVAITILASPVFCQQLCDYAEKLLIICVENMKMLYGKGMMVYNVHGLIHLAGDVRRFGSLDNFSSFPFENALKSLKKLVRKPALPLQQLVYRLAERSWCTGSRHSVDMGVVKTSEHTEGPVPREFRHARQYARLQMKDFMLTVESPDNCAKLTDGTLCFVKNILKDVSDIWLVVECITNCQSFFTCPMRSLDLGILQFRCRKLCRLLKFTVNVCACRVHPKHFWHIQSFTVME